MIKNNINFAAFTNAGKQRTSPINTGLPSLHTRPFLSSLPSSLFFFLSTSFQIFCFQFYKIKHYSFYVVVFLIYFLNFLIFPFFQYILFLFTYKSFLIIFIFFSCYFIFLILFDIGSVF